MASRPHSLGSHRGLSEQRGTDIVVPSWGRQGSVPAGQGAESPPAARGCSGSGDRHPGPPQSIPAGPTGLQVGPGRCLKIAGGHYLQQLRLSSFPSSFGSETAFTFVSLFLHGFCEIYAEGTFFFLENASDRNVFSYPLKLKAIKKRMTLMNRPCRITTLKLWPLM